MKKILAVSLLMLASACTNLPVDGHVTTDATTAEAKSDCANIKGVLDPQNGGKIYYTKEHRLYSFIKLDTSMGDKNFCSMSQADRAGFDRKAPEYFEDSAHNMVNCLESEGDGGSCHTYIDGIFQSLKIYDKVCGSPSKGELASTYISHAGKAKNGMDVSKYSGATSAFIKRYGC